MYVGRVQLAGLFAVLVALVCGAAVAETPTAGQGDTFEQAVAPFLKQHCTRCHGPVEQEADFAVHGLTAERIGDGLSPLIRKQPVNRLLYTFGSLGKCRENEGHDRS